MAGLAGDEAAIAATIRSVYEAFAGGRVDAIEEARGPLRWTLHEPLVTVHGDLAVARYLLDFEYLPPRRAAGRIRVTDVLRRDPDRWRIVHHHEGLLPAGPP